MDRIDDLYGIGKRDRINNKIDSKINSRIDNKKFNRYLRYVFAALMLSGLVGLMSLVSGCGDDEVIGESNQSSLVIEQSNQIQQVNSSFSTFDNPFLTFNYPASWEEDREMFDQYTITSLANIKEIQNKDFTGKRIDLTVSKLNIPNVNTIEGFKKYFYQYKLSKIDYKMIDDSSFINGNIAIIQYTDYNQTPFLRDKFYIWTNGDGKFYIIGICCDESNIENVKEIIDVFEKSLAFKQ